MKLGFIAALSRSVCGESACSGPLEEHLVQRLPSSSRSLMSLQGLFEYVIQEHAAVNISVDSKAAVLELLRYLGVNFEQVSDASKKAAEELGVGQDSKWDTWFNDCDGATGKNSLLDQLVHICVYQNDFYGVQMLLGYGANVNATHEWHSTPLHNAINLRYYEMAMFLLLNGADASLPSPQQHSSTLTRRVSMRRTPTDTWRLLVRRGQWPTAMARCRSLRWRAATETRAACFSSCVGCSSSGSKRTRESPRRSRCPATPDGLLPPLLLHLARPPTYAAGSIRTSPSPF